MIINPERFKISAAGFQSPNGNSTLYTADTINTFHFGRVLTQIRVLNMITSKINFDLLEISNANNLNYEYFKNQIPTKNLKEFILEISKNMINTKISKETMINKLKRTINKENTENKRKISKIKAQNLTKNLLNYFNINFPENLINSPPKLRKLFGNDEKFDKMFPNCLKNEKRIVIIIDNFSVHKTYLSKIICKILNIKLIYLPKYFPFLNQIEQLWRTMKNIIHRNSIPNINFLKKKTNELFPWISR
jgi:hypothetical protein